MACQNALIRTMFNSNTFLSRKNIPNIMFRRLWAETNPLGVNFIEVPFL
jgi:hypothetical protein